MTDHPSEHSAGTGASVDDQLALDHERLDQLLENTRRGLETRSGEAGQALESFDKALSVHMEWEEKYLFPAVSARASARSRRSIESLEIDHERIRGALADACQRLAEGRWAESLESLSMASTFLEGHNYDEEHGVYVEADKLLEPGQRRALLELFERTLRDQKP